MVQIMATFTEHFLHARHYGKNVISVTLYKLPVFSGVSFTVISLSQMGNRGLNASCNLPGITQWQSWDVPCLSDSGAHILNHI